MSTKATKIKFISTDAIAARILAAYLEISHVAQ